MQISQLTLIVDTSGSMRRDKIAALNQFMRDLIVDFSHSRRRELRIRVISTEPRWIIGPIAICAENITWVDVSAGGESEISPVIQILTEQYSTLTEDRKCIEVLVLLSDGLLTEPMKQFNASIQALDKSCSRAQVLRCSIAFGRSGDVQREPLLRFSTAADSVIMQPSDERFVEYLRTLSPEF